jgi:hypothetical protein
MVAADARPPASAKALSCLSDVPRLQRLLAQLEWREQGARRRARAATAATPTGTVAPPYHCKANTIRVAAPFAEAESREELPEGTAISCCPAAR